MLRFLVFKAETFHRKNFYSIVFCSFAVGNSPMVNVMFFVDCDEKYLKNHNVGQERAKGLE